MDNFKNRLALFTTKCGLCCLLISAGVGFIVIHVIAYFFLASFNSYNDESKPVLRAFHDIYTDKFSNLVSG